jgi:hypothetical protein
MNQTPERQSFSVFPKSGSIFDPLPSSLGQYLLGVALFQILLQNNDKTLRMLANKDNN